MKIIKLLIITLLYGTVIYPQYLQERLMSFESNNTENKKVLDISKDGLVLLKESDNLQSNYYIYKNNDEKIFVLSTIFNSNETGWFSQNQMFLILRLIDNNKTFIKFYDINNKKFKDLINELGDIGFASIKDFNHFIYALRIPDEAPKLFYVNANKETFITNAVGAYWSPDGRWLFSRDVKEKISTKKNKIIKKLKAEYSIYNTYGDKIITFDDFNNIAELKWSPNSNQIIFRDIGTPGFYILFFNTTNGFSFKEKYHNKNDNNFVDELEINDYDGKIYYRENIEENEAIVGSRIFLFDEMTKSNKLILESSTYVNKMVPLQNGKLIISKEIQKEFNETTIYKVNID